MQKTEYEKATFRLDGAGQCEGVEVINLDDNGYSLVVKAMCVLPELQNTGFENREISKIADLLRVIATLD